MNKSQYSQKLLESIYDYKYLKKHRIPLTDEERNLVISRKAVWHHGLDGEETPAIWKARSKSGVILYGCNTHRAMQIKKSLQGAIKAFDFIKTTS
jgi:hypothetical protein